MSAIKALAHIDPAGAILGAVGGPIRAYLRQRRDTIRCVVTMLTADEEDAAAASLHAELGNAEAAPEVGWHGGLGHCRRGPGPPFGEGTWGGHWRWPALPKLVQPEARQDRQLLATDKRLAPRWPQAGTSALRSTPCHGHPARRSHPLPQDHDSDFEGGEADAAALREAERWEPDPGARCAERHEAG